MDKNEANSSQEEQYIFSFRLSPLHEAGVDPAVVKRSSGGEKSAWEKWKSQSQGPSLAKTMKSCDSKRPATKPARNKKSSAEKYRTQSMESEFNPILVNLVSFEYDDDVPDVKSKKSEAKECRAACQQGRRNIVQSTSYEENDSGVSNHFERTDEKSLNPRPTRYQKKRSTEESSHAERAISERDGDDPRRKRQKWFENHQNDGTWIMCCDERCGKWRYVLEYDDPAEVPEKWYCRMNHDLDFASCDVPEEEVPPKVSEELIESKYCVGSIVWARLDGYPWWPAMVHNCPESQKFCKLESFNVAIKYYVIYFNWKKGQGSWIPDKDCKAYATNPRETVVKKTKFKTREYKKFIDDACALASEALKLSLSQRIKTFEGEPRYVTDPTVTINPRSNDKRADEPSVAKNRSAPDAKRTVQAKRYNIGDVVWAHPKNFPWWPAMIDECPILGKHYRIPESPRKPIEYHVIYFNEKKLEIDWWPERGLKLFVQNPRTRLVKTTIGEKVYKFDLSDACTLAREAMELSPKERLQRFGVEARDARIYKNFLQTSRSIMPTEVASQPNESASSNAGFEAESFSNRFEFFHQNSSCNFGRCAKRMEERECSRMDFHSGDSSHSDIFSEFDADARSVTISEIRCDSSERRGDDCGSSQRASEEFSEFSSDPWRSNDVGADEISHVSCRSNGDSSDESSESYERREERFVLSHIL